MDYPEEWVQLKEFPDYAISNWGRVMNIDTELMKTPSPNQQGIASVNLIFDGEQYRRSVAVMVATIFLPPPPRETFDTPINLDGDRMNNMMHNLEWRPRWFAMKYHTQTKNPPPFGFTGVIELMDTGEIFENIRDCSTRYGLLEKEIILAAHDMTPVFPTWQRFRLVD